MSINILFAFIPEAKFFLNNTKYKFKQINKQEYRCNNIRVFITGVGKPNISSFFQNVSFDENSNASIQFNKQDIFIKAGTCASINHNHIMECVSPRFVTTANFHISDISSRMPHYKQWSNNILLSQEQMLNDPTEVQKLHEKNVDFVDMELAFMLDYIQQNPIIPVLIPTDNGGADAKQTFLANVKHASKIISDNLCELITTLP